MSATPSPATSPLRLLANVVTDLEPSSPRSPLSPLSPSSAGPSHPPFDSPSPPSRLHIPCKSSTRLASHSQRPLQSSNSNLLPDPDSSFVPYVRHRRRPRKHTDLNLKSRMHIKSRRKELLDKATKIKSLDNSPVNERQLLVLRMIYDEITMYPCESWMVLVAICIQRAYKQVKNWFSNERQKNRTGESIPYETEDGDKVKMRTSALSICEDWSDTFFEEVVMIYNFKVQRNSLSAPKVVSRRSAFTSPFSSSSASSPPSDDNDD